MLAVIWCVISSGAMYWHIASLSIGSPNDKFSRNEGAVSTAILNAKELMDSDFDVLKAELVLAKALKKVTGPGNQKDSKALDRLRRSPIFIKVSDYADLYNSARRNLEDDAFNLVWESEDAKMFVKSTAGGTSFEYKLVARIDAPLRSCLAPLHERDLMQQYQPMFIEPHMELLPSQRHHGVVRTLSRVLSVTVESVFELLRVPNKEFGFLTEVARSDVNSNLSGLRKPPGISWWGRRIGVNNRNLWIPVGGKSGTGTILVSVAHVHVGVPIPGTMFRFLANQLSKTVLANLRRGAALAEEVGSPWHKRIILDKDGFYAELDAVESVTVRRGAVSLSNLPDPSVFDRPLTLKHGLP